MRSYFIDRDIWDPSWWFLWCETWFSLNYCFGSKNYQIFHQNFHPKIWRFTFSGCADGRNFWWVLFFQSLYVQDVLRRSRLFLSLKLVEIRHDILNVTLTESYFNSAMSFVTDQHKSPYFGCRAWKSKFFLQKLISIENGELLSCDALMGLIWKIFFSTFQAQWNVWKKRGFSWLKLSDMSRLQQKLRRTFD